MSDPVIYKYADLSTGHLPQTEMDNIAAAPPRVIEHEYGAWVNVLPVEDEDEQEWDEFPVLRCVLAWARGKGARWVNLDRDGDLIPDELPTWEW